MKPLAKIISLFILILAYALTVAAQNNVQLVIEGKVVRVADGDTITVLDKDNKQHRIRFQGIDAPEKSQAYGQASKENLAKMVFDKHVTVEWSKVDKYRRKVGKVLLEGRDINIEQIKAGLAWHYKKYQDEQSPEDRASYAKAEEEARAARKGLWQDPNPVPPSDYRQKVKAERWGPPPPEGTIIGNKNSKKYHRPDCPGYRDIAERNRVFFKTVEEAEAAGYKRAGNCPPEEMASKTSTKPTPIPATKGDNDNDDEEESDTSTPTPTVKPAPSATSSALASTSSSASSASESIIGNKNSKIYHKPGCPGYKSVSKNQVKFNSAAEAETAGFTLAKNCKK